MLYGLIGPNGAGKTTVFNMLTGVYRPNNGTIKLDGENLVGKNPAQICQTGVARTFQNIRLFKKMSVLDNVKVALHNETKYSLLSLIHILMRNPLIIRGLSAWRVQLYGDFTQCLSSGSYRALWSGS